MVSIGVEGPLSGWVGPLTGWLGESGVSPTRARRAVSAFGRLSVWMAGSGLGVPDLDEALIDGYVLAEQQRSGSWFPAAA